MLEVGHKKVGGRKKGTPNKGTAKVRESITMLIEDNIDLLQRDLKELEPKERIDAIAKLLPYCIPKLQNVEYNDKSIHQKSALLEHIENLKLMQK